MIRVETTWLEHCGGTKYYETVLFADDDSRQAMLVKRYGAMPSRNGGGAIIVERGTVERMRASAKKIIGEKTSSRKGYERVESEYGFHGVQKSITRSRDFIESVKHYVGPNTDVYRQIRDFFPIDGIPAAAPAAPREPEPEIDRGASWGAF